MNIYEHIGKLFVRFDVHTGVSPVLEAILPPDIDPEQQAKSFESALKGAIEQTFSGSPHRLTMDHLFSVSVMHSRIIESKEEEDKQFEKDRAVVGEALQAGFDETTDRNAENPDNGKEGFWAVWGIRHNAVVKASSAPEAVEKAHNAEKVDKTWENPEADFIGEEMPEVW